MAMPDPETRGAAIECARTAKALALYAKLPGTLARPIRPQPISRVTNEARSFSS
ncbi:hypothetical protein GCM10010923_12800 [Blastomonas marina]|uniref:Uncharacterized protein n=1 Tax=Blastomonas marina TaxID=1867408 RepID=A0ABQ1FBB0_9SPHN|nr:hypothetical protein GCM10010923_12800 [Blastomonas marina]